jgi:hypothetical protein
MILRLLFYFKRIFWFQVLKYIYNKVLGHEVDLFEKCIKLNRNYFFYQEPNVNFFKLIFIIKNCNWNKQDVSFN